MKKQTWISKARHLMTLMLLLVAGQGFSQHTCTIDNITYPTANTLEFDIMINSSATNLQLQTFQMGLEFNYPGMAGGGTVTAAFVPGSATALLPVGFQDLAANVSIGATPLAGGYRQIRMTAKTGVSVASGIFLTSSAKYATVRLTNTQPWPTGATPNFIWSFATATNRTRTSLSCFVNGSSTGTPQTTQTNGGTPSTASPSAPYAYIAGPQYFVNGNPSPPTTCPTVTAGTTTDAPCFGALGSQAVDLSIASAGSYTVDGGSAINFGSATSFSINNLSQGAHVIVVTPANCSATTLNITIGGPSAPPAPPSLACYETASFNSATCQWDVTGTQPAMPSLACYQTASFNNGTCSWDVTGSQPAMPTLACYQTASFNNGTCQWDVTGTQPAMPSLACYETASFNSTTCQWDVTGSQPAAPTGLACYQTASFNNGTCQWDVTGTQPTMPNLACYQTASFNNGTCSWDVTGSQPAMPTLACYETASFNNGTCSWDVTGSMPAAPTGLACYQTASFNSTTCQWDVTGTQPAMPTLACYETASFNNGTCSWDVTGSMPAAPTGLACYQTASFNSTTCQWDVTGTQPAMPTLACYETASFNNGTCSWDVTGSMPAAPTGLACYQTASFNSTTCQWDVTGTQPAMPNLACYETASFNNNTCSWDVTGSQPAMPNLACYETASFNNTTCSWDVTGSQPAMPNLACYETASFNNNTCSWDVTGSMPVMPNLACYETASFNNNTCSWDVTGTPPATITENQTQCGSYFWLVNGQTYTQGGTYTATVNCVPYVLNLTIVSSTNNTTTISSCGPYTWPVNGQIYSTSGTYTYVNGCATETLILTVTGGGTTTNVSICGNGTYTWAVNGQTYNTSGTYTFTSGCATHILNLSVAALPIISGVNVTNITAISAHVNYNAVAGIGWYELRWKKASSATWITGTNGTATTKVLINLQANTLYQVQVRGYCTAASVGPWSPVDTFTTGVICSTPINVTVSSSVGNQATVSWTNVPGAGFYNLRYKLSSSTIWIPVSNVTNPKTLNGLIANSTYNVQVAAGCNGGNAVSPWSATTTFTTAPACGVPSNLLATNITATTAKLNWTATLSTTSYSTRYKKVSSSAWINGSSTSNSKNIAGLQAGQNYEFQVRSTCTGNVNGAWSPSAFFTTSVVREESPMDEVVVVKDMSIYPNPTRDELNVDFSVSEYTITTLKLIDMSGRTVKQVQVNAEIGDNKVTLHMGELTNGIYTLQIVGNDKLMKVSRIIKN